MAITISLSGLNGDWAVNAQSGINRIWTRGIYSIVYSDNMFGGTNAGWVVKITDGIEIFGIVSDTDPWVENPTIIWNPNATGYDDETTANMVVSIISEANPIDINPAYYKCASVNSNIWSGYKMNWDKDNGWIAEGVLTENLNVSGFTPEIDKVYNVNTTAICYLHPDTPNAEIIETTASAKDIKSGQTAVLNGVLTTGTMPTSITTPSGNVVTITEGYKTSEIITVGTARQAETIVPGAEDIVIPADTYLAGALTIQAVEESGGDIDLTNLTAENIKYGVTINGIVGTFPNNLNIQPGGEELLSGVTAMGNFGEVIMGTITRVESAEQTPFMRGYTESSQKFTFVVNDGYYSTTSVTLGFDNLKSDVIKKGVSIGLLDITGTYEGDVTALTSDADATAADILKDKTAYVNGIKLTGKLEVTGGGGFKFYECASVSAGGNILNVTNGIFNEAVMNSYSLIGEYQEVETDVFECSSTTAITDDNDGTTYQSGHIYIHKKWTEDTELTDKWVIAVDSLTSAPLFYAQTGDITSNDAVWTSWMGLAIDGVEMQYTSTTSGWSGYEMTWSDGGESTSEYPYTISGCSEEIVNQKYKQTSYTDSTEEYISEDGQVTIKGLWEDMGTDYVWVFYIINSDSWSSNRFRGACGVSRVSLQESTDGYWFDYTNGEEMDLTITYAESEVTSPGWVKAEEPTTGLQIVGYTPEEGKVYTTDTTALCYLHPDEPTVDVITTTASATDIKGGLTAVLNGTLTTGTMPTSTVTPSGNVVTITEGYKAAETITIGTAKEAETIVPGAEDIVIPADTYLKGDLTIQAVGESGGTGDSNITYGVLDADGNFQALDLSGENPVDSGTAESISELIMYQTGHNEPAYPSGGGGGESSGIKFYECKTYTPDADAYTKYSFTMSGASDTDANATYERTKWVETPGTDSNYTISAQWTAANGYKIVEENGWGAFSYYIKNASGTSVYGTDMPLSARATDYSTIPWLDMDTYKSVTLTFSAIQTEDIPATPEGWTGVLMQQDTNTGIWSASATNPVNLTVQYLTPKVGKIYSEDTSIQVRKMYDGAMYQIPSNGLSFYAPLEYNYTDVVSGLTPIDASGTFAVYKGIPSLFFDGTEQGLSYTTSKVFTSTNGGSIVFFVAPSGSLSNWVRYVETGNLGVKVKQSDVNGWGLNTTDGAWQSIVLTSDSNSNQVLYLNAINTAEKALGTAISPDSSIQIATPLEQLFRGYIAHVAVYDRELSSAEVLEIHKTLMEGVTQ